MVERLSAIVTLLALTLAGCSSSPDGETVTLEGHVVDPQGQPVAGIQVGYYKRGLFASDRAAVSDSDGAWELELPKAFLAPPAGRIFFQDAKHRGMTMHRASELPEPVVFELPPPRPPEEEEGPQDEDPAQSATRAEAPEPAPPGPAPAEER